jgi:hypothetical protein
MPELAKQKSVLSYFYLPIFFTVVGLALGCWIGGPTAMLLISVLIVLEISLSFDNAVVNATVLRNWPEKWRKVFLFWGILIAVFGMRLVFPIAIVAVAGQMNPMTVIDLALNDPDQYGVRLASMEHLVAGFGASFLTMVGLAFFLDEAKDHHWLGPVEGLLAKLGPINMVTAGLALLITLLVQPFVAPTEQLGFLVAAVWGIVAYILIKGISSSLAGDDDDGDDEHTHAKDVGKKIVRASVMGFLYLEVLDASFSFDGVIGALALTNYLPFIMIGLGVGAFYVRETTMLLLDRETMDQYQFLEHGAFWAILALAAVMFAKACGIHLPEWLVGLSAVGFLGAAVLHSHLLAKAEVKDAV